MHASLLRPLSTYPPQKNAEHACAISPPPHARTRKEIHGRKKNNTQQPKFQNKRSKEVYIVQRLYYHPTVIRADAMLHLEFWILNRLPSTLLNVHSFISQLQAYILKCQWSTSIFNFHFSTSKLRCSFFVTINQSPTSTFNIQVPTPNIMPHYSISISVFTVQEWSINFNVQFSISIFSNLKFEPSSLNFQNFNLHIKRAGKIVKSCEAVGAIRLLVAAVRPHSTTSRKPT